MHPPARPFSLSPWIGYLAFVVLVAVAYLPAWHGGRVWDDDGHLTPPALQPLAGLWRIWFVIGATQQYYPVVHSVFWGLHRLFGDDTLGYHLVNIALHATVAWLFVRVLQRLAVPGAWLAGAIFALHPIEVESVAWMSELKNTLSAVWYLAAALAYLRFDATRSRRWYGAALALFALALFSKTVTATLPAALLVVFWWQRGRLDWRSDVAPLVPFALLGANAGLLTAWVERTMIGATGVAFQLSAFERVLIAGRATLFYLEKLIWPANLMFVYPRWTVSAAVWWQWAFPAGVMALAAAAWLVRGRTRAPLAVLLLFVGALFPALGFVNVYPFVFSFVADHFQYLAGLPVIALAAASLVRLAGRWRPTPAVAGVLAGALLMPLGLLTWHASRQYQDGETLYRATLDRNPSCWMAHNNLGQILQQRARASEASVSAALLADATAHYRAALALNPTFAEAHNNLGSALLDAGAFDEATAEYREARKLKPDIPMIRDNLGLVARRKGYALEAAGRLEDALRAFGEALEIDPNDCEAHGLLADALAGERAFNEAIPHYQYFLRARPRDASGWTGLAIALASTGDRAGAVQAFETAVRLDPSNPVFRDNLSRARAARLP